MYVKKLLIFFCTILILFSTLEAQDTKIGKFTGGKNTTMPEWFLNSFLDLSEDIENLASEKKKTNTLYSSRQLPLLSSICY